MPLFDSGGKPQAKFGFLSVLIGCSLLLVLAACAPAAAPPTAAPVSAPKTSAPPASAPAPTSATKAAASESKPIEAAAPKAAAPPAVTEMIEGAKKEGKVAVYLQPGLLGEPLKQIREGIKKKYGVDLEISALPSQSYPTQLAKATTEYKTGAAPTVDMIPLADLGTIQAIQAGFAEKVDWAPLLIEGTPKEAIKEAGHGLATFTSHQGLMYNPRVISAAEAPKKLSDLANPKWRGKIAAYNYANNYLTYAFALGADRVVADLRAMMKNNPVLENYAGGQTRFLAGEYPILLTQSPTYVDARAKNVPAEWVSHDISWVTHHNMVIVKNSKNKNAAKLLAVYLAGAEGHKLHNDVSRGSMLYPANTEFDIHQQDMKAGLKFFTQGESPQSVEFFLSDKGKQIEREIAEILKGS